MISEAHIDGKELQNVQLLLQDTFSQIIKGYLDDAKTCVAGLQDGVAKKDAAKLLQHAYSLHTASAALGIVRAHKLSSEIESKVISGASLSNIASLIRLLEEELDNVTPMLARLISN